jgi:hypothetical protein
MSLAIREPWNPWTTAFLSSDIARAETNGLGHPPVAGSSPFVFASAWQRDEDGTVQRVAIGSGRRALAEQRGIAPR